MKSWQSVVIAPTATIRDALMIINTARSQFALVVGDRNYLLGTLSDGDIRRALLGGAALESPVEPWMCRTPHVASDGASLEDILLMMRRQGLHQVPIVDVQRCVIGLKTVDDFLQIAKRDIPVVIMAGGLGTRLNELTREKPKPMLPVGGRPVLEMIINRFVLQGFTNIWLAVNYRSEVIESYFGDGSKWGAQVRYLKENKRLGTAGALSLLPREIGGPLVVSNADVITSMDYAALVDTHKANGAVATMAVREQEFAIPFGVIVESEGRMMRIEEKPVHRLVVNAGIYVLSARAVRSVPADTYFDMPQLFETLIAQKQPVFCERVSGYWLDIGQRADYKEANELAARSYLPDDPASDRGPSGAG
jgi:dTDP-glucose pyrophosphorylase